MDTVNFTKFCILSGVKDNLNTKMDIEHNGKIYKVAICDALADEASIRSIKNKLTEILVEVETIMARATDLGLYVSLTPPKLAAIVSTQTPVQEVGGPRKDCLACKGHGKVKISGKDGIQEVDCKKCEASGIRPLPPKPVTVKVVDENGREQQIEFDGGVEAAAAKDGISFVQTNEKDVMSRTQSYSQNSFKQGYAVKDCSPCRGLGKVRISNKNGVQEIPCKRCNGAGVT